MRRLHAFMCIGALAVLLLSAGCYTVLRHPIAERGTHEGSYYRSCADCHADAAYYHPYYSYGSSHYRWQSYYGYPWWHDDYWWWPEHEEGGEPRDVETGGRHLWGPGGWPSGGWGFTKGGTTPSTPARPPESDDKDDSKSQPESDEKKDEDGRHIWDKPKKGF